MLRARLPLARWGLYLGGGAATGDTSPGFRTVELKYALWLHAEVGFEFRASFGLSLRVYGGAAHALTAAGCEDKLVPGAPCSVESYTVPYWGLALGYAF